MQVLAILSVQVYYQLRSENADGKQLLEPFFLAPGKPQNIAVCLPALFLLVLFMGAH